MEFFISFYGISKVTCGKNIPRDYCVPTYFERLKGLESTTNLPERKPENQGKGSNRGMKISQGWMLKLQF